MMKRIDHDNARIYFDALKEIGGYMKPAKLRRDAERMYGLEYLEVLEMAYESVLTIAQKATYRPGGRAMTRRRLDKKGRALDLFCGAGGASMGLHRAGYEVTGVDLAPQPNYPFRFIQADALTFSLDGFDLIWASPPCQAFTAYRRRPSHVPEYPNLIPVVRERLQASGIPYVIENVPGAPLIDPVQLCGSSFGLDVRRHRLFECSFPVHPIACNHAWQTPRFTPATNRTNPRSTVEVGVWRIPLGTQRAAMGIGWMTRKELSQAIPPAYSEYLARNHPLTSRLG